MLLRMYVYRYTTRWYPATFKALMDGCEAIMEGVAVDYMHTMLMGRSEWPSDEEEEMPIELEDEGLNHTFLRMSAASVAGPYNTLT